MTNDKLCSQGHVIGDAEENCPRCGGAPVVSEDAVDAADEEAQSAEGAAEDTTEAEVKAEGEAAASAEGEAAAEAGAAEGEAAAASADAEPAGEGEGEGNVE